MAALVWWFNIGLYIIFFLLSQNAGIAPTYIFAWDSDSLYKIHFLITILSGIGTLLCRHNSVFIEPPDDHTDWITGFFSEALETFLLPASPHTPIHGLNNLGKD